MSSIKLNASKNTKQTSAGEIPVDWGCLKLGSLLTAIDSGFSVNAEDVPSENGSPGMLKLNAVFDGRFYPDRNKAIPEVELANSCKG